MKYLKLVLAYISIIAILLFAIYSYEVANKFVVITFTAIILICTFQLFSNKSNVTYGLSQIFYIFCLFFLGIAPLFQYLNDITLWGGKPFTDNDYIKTNLLILMSLIIYKCTYIINFIILYLYKFLTFTLQLTCIIK